MSVHSTARLVSFSKVLKVGLCGIRLHCVQKKTTTYIFFHISMNNVWI